MKQLQQSEFTLTLISDLGMLPIAGLRSDSNKPRTARFVELECTCGTIFTTRADIGKRAKSCKLCSAKSAGIKHGESKSKLYVVWAGMKSRCNNNHEHYTNISVCDNWHEFTVFRDWALTNGYSEGLSIDRIGVNGDYEPTNCRWTTQNVQTRNTRRLFAHNTSGFRGVCYDTLRSKWKAYIKVDNKKKELGRFDTALAAAIAYDTYVITNELEHTTNGVTT